MRILLISAKPEKLNGGIAVWTDRYMSCCSDYEIDCTLVNTEVVGKRAQQGTAKRSLTDEFVRTKRIFKGLKKELNSDYGVELAHLNTSCGTFGLFRDYMIARRIRKKGIPVVTHYHCDIPFWIHNSISKKYLKKLASLSSQNLVLCENSRRFLLNQFRIESIKMPNFIADGLTLQTPKRIEPQIRHAFFVGRVEEAKGAAEIYTLAKRFPEITFELVGEVNQSVAQWEKPNNVVLVGGLPHEKVIERLDAADVFLLPSHSEGFSVALVESMARGVPAIATDVGAAADMLADGCGMVVEKGNVDAMEQAIRKLESSDIRGAISQAAVAKVKKSYTIDAVMERFRSIYEQV